MSVSNIINQSVLSNVFISTWSGRLNSLFQNKYLAAATLCVTAFALLRLSERVSYHVQKSNLTREAINPMCNQGSGKHWACRSALAEISSSIVMVVGTFGISRLLQLPFSRGTTVAVVGWTLVGSYIWQNALTQVAKHNALGSDDSESIFQVQRA
jgi:hypothetical protein